MQEITEKARQIRDVIRYIKVFKNAVTVVYLDDEIISSSMLPSLIHDISLIHESGIKVVIVPGCRKRINQILTQSNISWEIKNGQRVTKSDAMDLIKMAAFDVSNTIMTSLSGEKIPAVIGNWVKAHSKGVINGIDYGTTGEIESINTVLIEEILKDGFVPILPCIGWSATGKPYNISSINLATEIAVNLEADKLFFILPDTQINPKEFTIPKNINLTSEFNIPAMNLKEISSFIKLNKTKTKTTKKVKDISKKEKMLHLFSLAKEACSNGVSRVHILDGSVDGILPCEIYSSIGSGTMVYNDEYSGFRDMTLNDISSVLSLMDPFIKRGILLPRTKATLTEKLSDYTVYQVDGGIHACAALHIYNSSQAEIAGVAVDESYSKIGIGVKLIEFLLKKAAGKKIKSVFVLTTQTADWFEKIGFKSDSINSIPPERKAKWSAQRNSKVLRIKL
ncbi:MAG: amino-acid N-acetyltransferase [Treponema sp.]|uniref:amino-acid N-acetyltransferase n=1 Tax=Treponema sp. TaxID=166 RepID=UPI001B6AD882|nr:amino-acid N-acetyltransferase [Treponema sp.]MBP5402060.1 amino-acid N-acetyltransferase [Treponema sp.]MBR5933393.1 amino-acid N-acetyltransferase [Treponema sp.]